MNQVGLVAQFVSFWLVTPELLSPSALHRSQVAVRTRLESLRRVLRRFVNLRNLYFLLVGSSAWFIASVLVMFASPGLGRALGGALGVCLFLVLTPTVPVALLTVVLWPLERLLVTSERWRGRFALLGAFFFLAGTAAQFAATLA